MCRNIRPLFNFDPPATDEDIRAASLQFVRKICGFSKPSQANEEAFERTVAEMAASARRLIDSLVTSAPPRDRGEWSARASARSGQRFDHARGTRLAKAGNGAVAGAGVRPRSPSGRVR